jgi:thiamine biosynthesis lipoprotein
MTGGAAALGLLQALPTVEAQEQLPEAATASPLRAATRTSRALGSDVSITALHQEQCTAALAVDDAFAELEVVEQLMSIYRPDSQLSRLNRFRELRDPHAYFVQVLEAASQMSRQSGGAFDITVQPLWNLFAAAQKQGRLPGEEEIDAARRVVDWRQVKVTSDLVTLAGEGSAITLNGIAQGFAADRAAAAIKARGVKHALINTGEIGALGQSSQGEAWKIGIQHPRREDAFVSLAQLADRCLATSGDYETTFSDDFRCHHLFDPRTGRSPTELAGVSVVAETAMLADALSTAAFVLGAAEGSRLVRKLQADAFFVLKSGRTLATNGFPLAS